MGPVPQRARVGHGPRGLQPDGTAWEYFPHDHARSRAYRWNEDGLAGFCDHHQFICFALALWNGRDPILKERLFGLTGHEGNHGEDVKEYSFYLDSTPTHSFMRWLYKYPQTAFPYADLVAENGRRGKLDPEYELLDTGVFRDDRYFDVGVEYAKASPEDVLITITATNRGPDLAPLWLLPTIWFRNTWAWGSPVTKPSLRAASGPSSVIALDEPKYGKRWLLCEGTPRLLFTDNETNARRLFGAPNTSAVRQGRHQRRGGRRRRAGRQPRARRHQGRGRVHPDDRARRERDDSPALHGRDAGRCEPDDRRRGFRDRARRAAGRGGRVLRDDRARRRVTGRRRRHAAGARRPAVVEAVLPLRDQGVARRRPRAAAASAGAARRPQPRVDPPLHRRRDLDAGQVGVPLVRGVGSRVPLRGARDRR